LNIHQRNTIITYASVFIEIEAKYAMLSNGRDFKTLLEIIQNSLIYIFDINYSKKEYYYLLDYTLNYQTKYLNLLEEKKFISQDNKNDFNESILKDNIRNKIKAFKNLLQDIDKTKTNLKKSFISNTEDALHKDDTILENIFKHYYNAFKLYEKVIINLEQGSHLHSANSFMNEFHQFFSHYSRSEYAYAISQQEGHNKKLYNKYINDNFQRGIRHLERAVLDIYKIIIIILQKNNKINKSQYYKLFQARQFEIDNISNSLENRIEEYKHIVNEYLSSL
jgi:hypothetical protein